MRGAATLAISLVAGPALAEGPCLAETTRFREDSAYLWDKHGTGNPLLTDAWGANDVADGSQQKVQRQTLTLLYADLNNIVKPQVAPDVTPDVIDSLGTAIRCVKAAIRTQPVDPKASTKALDLYLPDLVQQRLGMTIELGEPL